MIKRSYTIALFAFFFITNAFANLPYYPIQFPRDDAAHYENVPYQNEIKNLMEWWYYNGTLVTKTGEKLGYFISFNYVYDATKKWVVPVIQLQFADVAKQKVVGKNIIVLNKKSFSISNSELDVQYAETGQNYSLTKINNSYVLTGSMPSDQGPRLQFSIKFTPKPHYDVLLVGGNGLVDMWNNKNSYYYSYTKLTTEGFVRIGNETFEMDPEQSLSWMDHQWGDFFIMPGKNMWTWTSIQLKNGMDINCGIIYDKETKKPAYGSASIVMPDNSRVYVMDSHKINFIPGEMLPGEKHPTSYEYDIPELDLKLKLDALAPGQDVDGIWEGASKAEGMYQGQPITGQAFTENTIKYSELISPIITKK